jgi:hypothetical protein
MTGLFLLPLKLHNEIMLGFGIHSNGLGGTSVAHRGLLFVVSVVLITAGRAEWRRAKHLRCGPWLGESALVRKHAVSGKARKDRVVTLKYEARRPLKAYLAIRPCHCRTGPRALCPDRHSAAMDRVIARISAAFARAAVEEDAP